MKRKLFSQLVEESMSSDSNIRRDALLAIGESGNKRAITVLLPYARNFHSDDNELAFNVLAKYINDSEVREHFIKTSKKSDIYLAIVVLAIARFSDNVHEDRALVSALKRKSIDKYLDYCVSVVLARMGKVTSEFRDMITRPEIDTRYASLFVFDNTEERYRDARSFAFDAARYISKNDLYYDDIFASLFSIMVDPKQEDKYRRNAVRSIIHSLPEKLIPSIVRIYGDDPDAQYVKLCLRSYAKNDVYHEVVTNELMGIINHTNEDVQLFVKTVLAMIGSNKYVDALFDGVSSGDESIVIPCLVDMMEVKTDYAAGKLKQAVEYVSEHLEYYVRVALANVGDRDSIDFLIANKEHILVEKFKFDGKDQIDLDEVEPWGISALLTTQDESILQILSDCSYDNYEKHEIAFVRGLACFEYSVVRSMLRKRLQHKSRDIRVEAVKVIMSKANPEDLDIIEPLTKYKVIGHTAEDDKVRCIIADWIIVYDASKAIPILVSMINSEFVLDDEEWDVVSHCSKSLATLQASDALPVLRDYAEQEIEEYRYKNIVDAIAKIEYQTGNTNASQESSSDGRSSRNGSSAQSTIGQQTEVDTGSHRVVVNASESEPTKATNKTKEKVEGESTARKSSPTKTIIIVASLALFLLAVAAIVLYNSGGEQVQTDVAPVRQVSEEVQALISEWNDGLQAGSGYRVASCYQHKSGSVEKHAANLDRLFAKWGSIEVEAYNIEIKELNPYKAEVTMQRKIEYADRRTPSESDEHSWTQYSKYTNESLVVEKLNGEWLITYERPTNEKTSRLYYYDEYSESWWQKTGKGQYVEIIIIPDNPW